MHCKWRENWDHNVSETEHSWTFDRGHQRQITTHGASVKYLLYETNIKYGLIRQEHWNFSIYKFVDLDKQNNSVEEYIG